MDSPMQKLSHEIKKILLFGMFNTYEHGIPNRTAEQMNTYEDRLLQEYYNNPMTRTIIDKQEALLLIAINEYTKQQGEDNE